MTSPSAPPFPSMSAEISAPRAQAAVTLEVVSVVLYTFIAYLTIGIPLAVLPGYALYPLDWGDQIHDQFLRKPMLQKKQVLSDDMAQQLFPKSFTVTYWTCSWGDDLSQTHQHIG